MRHTIASLAAVTALALPGVAAADILELDTIDSVFMGSEGEREHALVVTGRRHPDGAETRAILFSGNISEDRAGRVERCHRFAVIAMNKPGRWRFTVDGTFRNAMYSIRQCGLTRID